MIIVQIDDFDIGLELQKLRSGRTDIGAIASFIGLVRDHVSNASVTALTLEHYPGMTEAELMRIEKEAINRWSLSDCLIIHRVGRMQPGDQIVLVICATAHRQAAFEATQFIMDYLKTEAPFWKTEENADATSHWVDARDSDRDAAQRWR